MLRVGLEPTIPMFERAKTVHALDSADIVTDLTVASPILEAGDSLQYS
jgi:hypothetical protein